MPGWDVASSVDARWSSPIGFPWLDAAVGVHPHDGGPGRRDRLGQRSSPLAGGPTRGRPSARRVSTTDRGFSPLDVQLANLRRNLELALETGQPAILHCRSAAGRARRPGPPRRRAPDGRFGGRTAPARLRGPAAGDHPLASPVRSTMPGRSSTWASRSRFSGLVFRHGRGAERGGRRARPGRPAAGRDRCPVPAAAGCAAPAERAGMGGRDGTLAGRAAVRGPRGGRRRPHRRLRPDPATKPGARVELLGS